MSDSVSKISLSGGKWTVRTGDLETVWNADIPHAAADQVASLHTQIARLRAALDLVARSIGEIRLLREVRPALKDSIMEIIIHIDRTLKNAARAAWWGVSDPLLIAMLSHAADERVAGRWDVASVLTKGADEIERLRGELEDRDAWYCAVMHEDCEQEEKHCACVPVLRQEIERLRAGKFQQGRPPEMIDFYYPDVVQKVRQDILAICKMYHLVGDAIYEEPLTRLTERIAEWVWQQLHLRECLNDGWALECDQIHAELRDCRRVLREMENETPQESRELRMAGARLYLKALNELHDSLDKCQRLEELLREAKDFMTPHSAADWQQKIERASAAGGGDE